MGATPVVESIGPNQPVTPYPYGRQAFGAGRYGGDHPAVIVPSTTSRLIPFLDANDRYQVIICTNVGDSLSRPQFRYWNSQPHLWPELLGDPSLAPPIYALDEHSRATTGRVELHHLVPDQKGEPSDALISHVVVTYVPRPSTIGTLDGGVVASTEVVIRGVVEVYGQQELSYDDGMGRQAGVVETHDLTPIAENAAAQSSTLWPNARTVTIPVRSAQRGRGFRVVLYLTLAELVDVTLLGEVSPTRFA